jgi:hypothetical protein
LAAPFPGHGADEIRFDVTVLPEFQKYAALLSHPGYAAMVLENTGLSSRPDIKMIVKERGRAFEARNAVLRFESRKGELYSYEMGVVVGVADLDTRLTFPVVLDVASLGSGKISVTMKPPLAALLPADFNVRLHRRVGMIAGISAQTTMLAYLGEITKGGSDAPQLAPMVEAILLDAYNRSGGPAAGNRDDKQVLPTADQWMLIITFVIWLLLVSVLFVMYVRRQRRSKPV